MRSADSYFPQPATGDFEFVVVGDLQAHPKAVELVKELQDLSEDSCGGLGHQMAVCLESAKGEPIVVARVTGMHEWLDLIGLFQDLQLTDRLEHEFFHGKPFDAAFS